MNGFLALGSPSLIWHSPDGVTWTQVYTESPGQILDQVADDGVGDLITAFVNVGSSTPTNKILVSHDNGLTWTAKVTAPYTAINGGADTFNIISAGVPAGSQGAGFLWDGTQFVVVSGNTSQPFGDMFSSTGETWQIWVETNLVNGYVPGDLVFFNGIYVGYSNETNKSLIWSATAGFSSGSRPTNSWTVGQIVTGGGFLKTNGSYVLAFGATSGGDDVVYKSTDGKAWTVSAGLNGLYTANGKDSIWWDATLSLWVLVGGDNTATGLFTSTDGLVWTHRIYDLTNTLFLNSVRRTGWFLSAVGNLGAFYISTDGVTWTLINAACPETTSAWDLYFIHSVDNYFVALGYNETSGDDALITSPDGATWTERQLINSPQNIYNLLGPSTGSTLTSYINPCTGHPVFPPAPPASVNNNYVLMRYMGSTAGFSLLTSLPNPPATGIITLREVQAPVGGTGAWAKAGDGSANMMALTDDASSYILFAGTQDGTITATAVTQPLPTPADLPLELWDSNKVFRAIWVEGEDLSNFQVYYATDRQLNADGTVASFPWGPFSIINNKVQMGVATAKRIILKFVHAAASATGVTPLITYINIDYDIMQEAN